MQRVDERAGARPRPARRDDRPLRVHTGPRDPPAQLVARQQGSAGRHQLIERQIEAPRDMPAPKPRSGLRRDAREPPG